MPEYDLDNPSSWVVIEKRAVLSESEETAIQDRLIDTGRLNGFGNPNLRMVWGVTHLDEMLLDGMPKYYLSTNDPVLTGHQWRDGNGNMAFASRLEDVPVTSLSLPVYSQTHLGERRFIIEIWRSPEFLKRSGRYQETFDSGEMHTYFQCRNCQQIVPSSPDMISADVQRICESCGSKRISPVDVREAGTGRLFRDFPKQGCYDFFFRFERADGTYHPPDGEALEGVRRLWAQHQLTFKEKDRIINESRLNEQKLARRRRHEIWHPDNLKPEESFV